MNEHGSQQNLPEHMYEMQHPDSQDILAALQETRDEIKRQKRLNYVLIALVLLCLLLVVVALALSASKKGGGESPGQTSPSAQKLEPDACSSSPCTNQGTCISIPSDNYVCSCVATYFGRNCELKMSVQPPQENDACSSGPCMNNGTCTNVYPDNYVCSCVATYYGRNCQHALSDTSFFVTYKEYEISIPHEEVITWDDVRYDTGNNYNTSTGAYTAPSNGYYQFSVTKRTRGEYSQFYILVDGKKVWRGWVPTMTQNPQDQVSCTVNVQLQAGQTVQVEQAHATVIICLEDEEFISSWFTGQMLYPLP